MLYEDSLMRLLVSICLVAILLVGCTSSLRSFTSPGTDGSGSPERAAQTGAVKASASDKTAPVPGAPQDTAPVSTGALPGSLVSETAYLDRF